MPMNTEHRRLCSSAEWADTMRQYALPWVLEGADLGAELLEIGPGFGAATRVLVEDTTRAFTALEIDPDSVELLRADFGPPAWIVAGDATAMPFDDATFTAAVCFTMLHHVPTAQLQNALFGEAHRVLRSSGVFLGSDSLASEPLAEFHTGDVYNPVDPATLDDRLRAVGFTDVEVATNEYALRFRARKP